jgi:hypothetical protein
MFLCRECARAHTNNPNPPNKASYTLQLVDNQMEVTKAMEDMRRVRVQLSSKIDYYSSSSTSSQQPLRRGIFDLLQKVRSSVKKGGGIDEPITSNLPSENIAMGIGSKRLAGTGRTAGILLKKQQKQGIVPTTFSSSSGESGKGEGGLGRQLHHHHHHGGRQSGDDGDCELTFLKNAIGQEIAFELEKGSGARANLLATRGRIRNKLIDAAAMKVGVDIGLVARVIIEERERQLQRRREEEKQQQQREKEGGNNKRKKQKVGGSGGVDELHFLQDNLGVLSTELSREEKMRKEKMKMMMKKREGEESYTTILSDNEDDKLYPKKSNYISDETDEFWSLPEEDRRAAFQAQYKVEVERQKKLLGIRSLDDVTMMTAPFHSRLDGSSNGDDYAVAAEELENVAWEDG